MVDALATYHTSEFRLILIFSDRQTLYQSVEYLKERYSYPQLHSYF